MKGSGKGLGEGGLGETDRKPGGMTENRESLSGLRKKQETRILHVGEAKAENGPRLAGTGTYLT